MGKSSRLRSQETLRQGVGKPFTKSPLLALKLPVWRSSVIVFFLSLAFLVLLVRAFWLQKVSTDFLQKQGEMRYARTLVLPAMRGRILDRNGLVLASSLPVKTVWAIPEDVLSEPDHKRALLAQALQMSSSELAKKLDAKKSFVYLKRQMDDAGAKRVEALQISGVGTRREYKRFYPEGEVSAHVVGFTNTDNIGLEGMELAFQKKLVGVDGSRRVIKDRLGRVIEDLAAVRSPKDGQDLVLSIDSRIQHIAFTALQEALVTHRAKAGAVVVADVNSGEILALANLPSYDPNQRGSRSGILLRNRSVTDIFEPGSTIKPFTTALALHQGIVKPNTVIDTSPGYLTMGSARISDSHPHDLLTVSEVLAKSSNVGTVKIAMQMPAKALWEMFTQIGLGQQPHLGFPGAAAGRVRSYKTWRPIEQATMSYGYGLSVSLVQMARAYMVFARDGEIIPLTLQKTDAAPIVQRIVEPQHAHAVREMLELATSTSGTGSRAQLSGYRVAGKTGTAHKLVDGRYADKFVASFIGFTPVSKPRLVIAVMIDEPSNQSYYGGEVAAPVFNAVAQNALRTLNVAPDVLVNNEVLK